MIELQISEPQLLAVFSYSGLNLYNSTYANVRFLPVTATYIGHNFVSATQSNFLRYGPGMCSCA